MNLVKRVLHEPDMDPGESVVAFTDGETSFDLANFKRGSFSAPHGDSTYDFFLYFGAKLFAVGDRLIVDSYQGGRNGNFNYPDPRKSLEYHRMFVSIDAGRTWDEVTDSKGKQRLQDDILDAAEPIAKI